MAYGFQEMAKLQEGKTADKFVTVFGGKWSSSTFSDNRKIWDQASKPDNRHILDQFIKNEGTPEGQWSELVKKYKK